MPLAVIKFTEDQDLQTLQDFARRVTWGIREYLNRNLKNPTGRLAESIRSYVHGKAIVVDSNVPYAKGLDRGTHESKIMWNLINRVIPIKLQGGRTIFRRVTLESIRRGKWRQKPRPGIDFVEKGIDLAKSQSSLRAQLAYMVEKP